MVSAYLEQGILPCRGALWDQPARLILGIQIWRHACERCREAIDEFNRRMAAIAAAQGGG